MNSMRYREEAIECAKDIELNTSLVPICGSNSSQIDTEYPRSLEE